MSTYENNHGFKIYDSEYMVCEPGLPDELIDTQWGRITYKHWLSRESLRFMEQNLRQSWLRMNEEGLVTLVSLREYQKEVHGKE